MGRFTVIPGMGERERGRERETFSDRGCQRDRNKRYRDKRPFAMSIKLFRFKFRRQTDLKMVSNRNKYPPTCKYGKNTDRQTHTHTHTHT